MNYTLLIQAALAALDLSLSLARTANMDEETLQKYIDQRNALRKELVEQAKNATQTDQQSS